MSSPGDRFCLALAWHGALSAWTSDMSWNKVADAAELKIVAGHLDRLM